MSVVVDVPTFAQVNISGEKYIEYTLRCRFQGGSVVKLNGDIVSKGTEWIVKHRYSNFKHLQKSLAQLFPDVKIPLCPASGLMRSFNSVYLETKRQQLDHFIKKVVECEKFRQTRDLLNFLGIRGFQQQTSSQFVPNSTPSTGKNVSDSMPLFDQERKVNPSSVAPVSVTTPAMSIGEMLSNLAKRAQEPQGISAAMDKDENMKLYFAELEASTRASSTQNAGIFKTLMANTNKTELSNSNKNDDAAVLFLSQQLEEVSAARVLLENKLVEMAQERSILLEKVSSLEGQLNRK